MYYHVVLLHKKPYSHVLTGTNPCINQAIHSAIDAQLFYFTIGNSGWSQKLMSSTVLCIEVNTFFFCSGTGVFKTYESFMLLRAIIHVNGNSEFFMR